MLQIKRWINQMSCAKAKGTISSSLVPTKEFYLKVLANKKIFKDPTFSDNLIYIDMVIKLNN